MLRSRRRSDKRNEKAGAVLIRFAAQSAGSSLDTIKRIVTQGLAPSGSESPEAFAKYFRGDFDRIARLVRVAGIKPE